MYTSNMHNDKTLKNELFKQQSRSEYELRYYVRSSRWATFFHRIS